jgi:hypothetical protein
MSFQLRAPNDLDARFEIELERGNDRVQRLAAALRAHGFGKRADERLAIRARLVESMRTAQALAPERRR